MPQFQNLLSHTILLIDDDDDDRDFFECVLKSIDDSFQFIGVARAEDGLSLLTDKLVIAPDIIFLDLNMPCMSGKEFLIEFRKLKRFRSIPIIIYSTTPGGVDLKGLDVSGFLIKPNCWDDLYNPLKSILEKIHKKEESHSLNTI